MSNPDLSFYLQGEYNWIISESKLPNGETAYIARYPKLAGCVTQANSSVAALAALKKLREPFLRKLYESGVDLPPPDSVGTPAVEVGAVVLDGGSSSVPEGEADEQTELMSEEHLVPEATTGAFKELQPS